MLCTLLHSTTVQIFYIQKYSLLHCTALQCTTMQFKTLHCNVKQCISLHYPALFSYIQNCSSLHFTIPLKYTRPLGCSALDRWAILSSQLLSGNLSPQRKILLMSAESGEGGEDQSTEISHLLTPTRGFYPGKRKARCESTESRVLGKRRITKKQLLSKSEKKLLTLL